MAVFVSVVGCKMGSLGVCGLVGTRVTSFACLTMLVAEIFEVVWMENDDFSTFSLFWVKSANVDRVSRAVEVTEGVVESRKATDCVNDENMVLYSEFSLVRTIFAFSPFLQGAGDCDVATQVRCPISRCWDVVVSVSVPVFDKIAEGVAGAGISAEEGSLRTWALVWVLTGFVCTKASVVVCKMVDMGLIWVPEME